MNRTVPITVEAREITIMTTARTIMLWGPESLFSSTLDLILTAQNGWRVVNITSGGNYEALIREVDKVDPDVIIFHRDVFDENFHLPTVLFQNHPNLKVIIASLTSNTMEVYSMQDVKIMSSSDLISIVAANTVDLTEKNE